MELDPTAYLLLPGVGDKMSIWRVRPVPTVSSLLCLSLKGDTSCLTPHPQHLCSVLRIEHSYFSVTLQMPRDFSWVSHSLQTAPTLHMPQPPVMIRCSLGYKGTLGKICQYIYIPRAALASAHQCHPLPQTLSVLKSTPQVRGMHTIIR